MQLFLSCLTIIRDFLWVECIVRKYFQSSLLFGKHQGDNFQSINKIYIGTLMFVIKNIILKIVSGNAY